MSTSQPHASCDTATPRAYAPVYLWRRRPRPGLPVAPIWLVLTALAVALLAATPSAADAQDAIRFVDGTIDFDAERAHVRFTATGEVGTPRVSSERGALRVRFPDATGDVRLDLRGDGGALRFVRVRPGAGDATVVVIRFTDARELPAEALRVESHAGAVDLSLSRSLLAPARVAEPATATPEPAPPSDAPAAEAEVETTGEAATPPALLTPPAPFFLSGRSASPTAGPTTSEGWASGRTGLLLGLTLVSGIALLVFSWMRSRPRGDKARLPISVVASHRLSPRHQLFVVRALGHDHLISVDGTRTERIASAPAPEARLDEERPSTPDFGSQLESLLSQPPRETSALSPTMLAPSATAHAGALAYSALSSPANVPSASTSEAVQGLLRLRARAFR